MTFFSIFLYFGIVSSDKAKKSDLDGLSKTSSFDDIYKMFMKNKIDTVAVRRVDSNENDIFDLSKASDMMTLATILKNNGDHLVGWKVMMNFKADQDVAAAMHIESVEKEETMKKKRGGLAEGFTLPDDDESQNTKHNPVKSEEVELNKGEYKQTTKRNDDDVDNDGDILAVWKPKAGSMKKQMKMVNPKNGTEYYVSYPWPHMYEPYVFYHVMVNVPRELWFVTPDFFSCLFASKADDMGYTMPFWQTSFKEIAIRKLSYGENEYKRKKKSTGNSAGRTINKIIFSLRIKKTEVSMFPTLLLAAQKEIEKLFHPAAQPGVSCLTFMKENSPGLVDWFKKNYPTDEKIEKCMHDVFSDVYGRTRNTVHGCHLDRFYMDHTIKELLELSGVNSWSEIDDKMDRVYKNWPISAPKWDAIETKPYDE